MENFTLEEETLFQEASGLPLKKDFKTAEGSALHAYRSALRRFKNTFKSRKNVSETDKDAWAIAADLEDRCNAEMLSRHEAKNPAALDPLGMEQFRVHSGETMRYNPNSEDRSYRGMFHPGDKSIKLDDGQYKRFDNFLMDIASGRITAKLEQRGFAETGGATGGFSVPDEFASWIFDTALESELVRPRAKVYPMKSATLKIPAWDSSNHTSSLFGGFDANWTPEAGNMPDQTAKLRQMELHSHKISILARASSEVLLDGLDFEAQIASAMIRTLSFNLDQAFLTGSGAGQPQGILNSASAVSVTRAGANAIAWADVYGMYSRLHPSCHSSKSTCWIASHSAMPQLMNLQVNNYLVFQPAMFLGIAGAVPASIFSYPILFTEKTSQLGVKGDLMLVDLSQYIIGLRADLSVAKSVDAYFDTDEVGFRIVARVDGQSLWNAPITPVNGSNSLSWCVILE